MRGNQSVFLFNVGIHYPLTLNFTTYKLLIDSIVEMLREETGTEHEGALSNQALSIWRSNVAVEAERFAKFFPQLNYTEWRFYTNQVIHVCCLENYCHRYRYRYRFVIDIVIVIVIVIDIVIVIVIIICFGVQCKDGINPFADQGRVVRKPISANPGLKINREFK